MADFGLARLYDAEDRERPYTNKVGATPFLPPLLSRSPALVGFQGSIYWKYLRILANVIWGIQHLKEKKKKRENVNEKGRKGKVERKRENGK